MKNLLDSSFPPLPSPSSLEEGGSKTMISLELISPNKPHDATFFLGVRKI
jgi:hypothetical protein